MGRCEAGGDTGSESQTIQNHAPLRYYAYLLRMWEERLQGPDSGGVWRFSLEDPQTGERRGFSDMARLLVFLTTQIATASPINDLPGESDD